MAYPPAVILAARVWNRPVCAIADTSLALLTLTVALALLSRFVYGSIEKPSARSVGTAVAAVAVRWGTPISAVLPLLLALALEQDSADALLAGCFSAAVLGIWCCLHPFAGAAHTSEAARMAVACAQCGVVACGLWANQMLWLLPLPAVLLLAGALVHWPPTGLTSRLPLPLVRVAGAGILTIGVASMAFATPAVPCLLDPIGESLSRVVGPGDTVTVLGDRDFTMYSGEEWLGQVVTGEDLTLRLGSPVAHETFVLVDPADLDDLSLRLPNRLRLELRIRSWFDEYHLLRVLDTPGTREN